MGNYGKSLLPLGIAIVVPAAIMMSDSGSEDGGGGADIGIIIALVIGIVILVSAFARLVQGSERKIMGQIIRPKAAARGSAIWSLAVFNITPFLIKGSPIMDRTAPFPIAILTLGSRIYTALGYGWMPFVLISFFVIFILGLSLSGKYPKIINIIFNFIMLICFSFWLNFSIQFFLWTFFADKENLVFFEDYAGLTSLSQIAIPLSLSLGLCILSLYLVIRMLKQISISFSNLEVFGGTKQFSIFVSILIVYILGVSPVYIGYQLCMENNSYMTLEITDTVEVSLFFINFIALIFIGIVLVILITTLLSTIREFSKKKTGEGAANEPGFGIGQAMFFVILFIAWAPIFMPLVDRGENTKDNSIYNPTWNGWSGFRTSLIDEGYDVMAIQSSISTISQLDSSKQIILVIPGPNLFYNPASEVPYFLTAFKTNFSMFICEDHGTVETLLFEMFVASMFQTPVTFIPKGVVRDNFSYWKNPAFPVINLGNKSMPFGHDYLNEKVDQVVLSSASGFLGGSFLESFGWEVIGETTPYYSYVDVDDDGMFDQKKDVYKFPDSMISAMDTYGGEAGGFSNEVALTTAILEDGLPLGGITSPSQPVFSVKEIAAPNSTLSSGNGTYGSRVFIAGDATWLDNELISIKEYDNLQLALNVMKYLACGRAPEDCIIVFDEAHIRPETGQTELTSAATFGKLQGYVNWLSTNPILGLVYPAFSLYSLNRWIPATDDTKKKIQLRDLMEAERTRSLLKFRTSSFFSQKINWYRQHKKYKQALLQLYRRLGRRVNALLGDSAARSVNDIINAVRQERGKYIKKDVLDRMRKFFNKIYALKANKDEVKNESEFEELFMEMGWVNDNLSR
jgi:hypothetical protein